MLMFLAELDVSFTAIAKLPNTIVNLKSLKVLKTNSSGMKKLPKAIGALEKLEEIHGRYCSWLEMIPVDIGRLPVLKVLKLTRTRVKNVPKLPQSLVNLCLSSGSTEKVPEISNLVSLRKLELHFVHSSCMRSTPKVRTSGPYCMLALPSVTRITSYLGCLYRLKELYLVHCWELHYSGQHPPSLRELTVSYCSFLEVDISNLENLLTLEIMALDCDIQGLEGLTSLQCLILSCCESSKFSGLERLENLHLLLISACPNLQTLPNFSNLKNLKAFGIRDCPKLVEIEGLDRLESLESLQIGRGISFRCLPDLSNLKKKLKKGDKFFDYFRFRERIISQSST